MLNPPGDGCFDFAVAVNNKMKIFSPLIAVRTAQLAILIVGLLLAAGCGDHTSKVTAEESKTFDSAPPEVKQTWEKALAADKANDYVAAAAALDSLKKMILSDQQSKALDAERNAFSQRLLQAVDKNDPTALQAIQNSKKSQGDSKTR